MMELQIRDRPVLSKSLTASLVVMIIAIVGSVSGCASMPPSTPAGNAVPGLVAALPGEAIHARPAPMTLPQFLGVNTVVKGCSCLVYRARVRLTPMLPMLEPRPISPPLALGHPSNLSSPSPAVATAATIQQSEAEAPAKVSALAFLANYSCSQNPQVEESLLAGMDDLSPNVRAAAVQAVIDGSHQCSGQRCGSCRGCCTIAVRERLAALAYQRDASGCYLETDSRVRRLARVALQSCGGHTQELPQETPQEFPPQEIIEQVFGPNDDGQKQ
jgi:hypothetical protein